ncbi:NUDIX hydrolase [Gordonia paraffinivorans]|uniref:NUDIX hydrolase n=1 Tax=Gordonia paraffinivorans TaxID=175628 RepID=UPI00144873F1|nr:NUDIX hydrolase [Gordonia paraffinivorans]
MTRRIVAVGAVITDEHGRILLVQRRNPPAAGKWSIPGGKVEPGESLEAAVEREILEETGLHVEVCELLWSVDIPVTGVDAANDAAADDAVFEVHDFAARVRSGTLRAGDDAADAGWFGIDEMAGLPVTKGLPEYLRAHGQAE